MRHSLCLGIAILISATVMHPAFAAPPKPTVSPKITIAHKGGAKLVKDLQAILNLTTMKQRKQWKVLKEQIDVFLKGVDPTKPVRLDIAILKDGSVHYRPSIPVKNINAFRKQNLGPGGIRTVQQRLTLFQCKANRGAQPVYLGFLRYAFGYAMFNENKNLLSKRVIVNPRIAIRGLLAAYDMGMVAENQKTDAKSIEARRAWVKKQAKELLAAVKQKVGESKEDYALRKLTLEISFEEAERFYAESSGLQVGWNMDLAKMTGRMDLDLTAIDGSSLARAFKLLGVKPSHFASVPTSKDAIMRMRINHPLDDQRKKSILRFFTAIHASQVAQTKVDAGLTKDEKQAREEVADLVLDMMKANLKAGLFDVFTEVRPNMGKNTALGGFATVDGRKMIAILKKLPKMRKGTVVAMNFAKQGDVDIHQVTFKVRKAGRFETFLGTNRVYVGTSKEAVWFASDLKPLTDAIKAKANPPKFNAGDPFVDVFVKVAPWLELLEMTPGAKGDPGLSKLARDAFKSGQDGITMQLRRKGDKVVGNMDIQTDVLRFVGAMLARFSEKTLDPTAKDADGN